MIATLFVPAIVVSMGAYAADDAANRDTKDMGTAAMPPATDAHRAVTSDTRQMKQTDMRATDLIGMDVENAQGEDLGEVEDLIVDVKNGGVYYAVLSFGETLGLGGKLFAYPIRAFSTVANGDDLVLHVDRSKLEGAPGFDSERYPDWASGRYAADVDRYFGRTLALEPKPGAILRRASEFIGKDVVDRSGTNVGEIEDMVITMGNGKIHYAVLEFDRSWNLDDKLLAVPLAAFSYAPGRDNLVMNVDKSALDTKLAFDKNRWPDINDPKYLVDVDRYLVLVVPTTAGTTSAHAVGNPTSANAGTASGSASASASSSQANNAGTGSQASPPASNVAASDATGVFARLDTDGDGKLTPDEARSDPRVHDMWESMNKGGDDTVSRSEFMSTYPSTAK
jgi:sporulation protein YlmC with PRC-barrel domain